jgi:hypothetical protein
MNGLLQGCHTSAHDHETSNASSSIEDNDGMQVT